MALRFDNVFRLGIKELRSLFADKVLLALIVWAFSGAIYEGATGVSQELRNAPVAIVDEDRSPLSLRIADALHPPYFRHPEAIRLDQLDRAMDLARYSFVLVIPANFQRDLAAGRRPEMQLDIDATVLYALGTRDPALFDREVDSPYNTYLVNGLPPTPISSPGRASLEAAAAPAQTDYLFYVLSDLEGHHAFAATLDEHNANVAAAREAGVLG